VDHPSSYGALKRGATSSRDRWSRAAGLEFFCLSFANLIG
ncbi:hypothetical protein Tsp_13847, partial [Trichinella spiralis]